MSFEIILSVVDTNRTYLYRTSTSFRESAKSNSHHDRTYHNFSSVGNKHQYTIPYELEICVTTVQPTVRPALQPAVHLTSSRRRWEPNPRLCCGIREMCTQKRYFGVHFLRCRVLCKKKWDFGTHRFSGFRASCPERRDFGAHLYRRFHTRCTHVCISAEELVNCRAEQQQSLARSWKVVL